MTIKTQPHGEIYRRKMVEALKADGQWIMDNAEDLMTRIDHNTGFTITIDYKQPHEYVPEIRVHARFIKPEAIKKINPQE